MNADGSSRRQIATGSHPSWSPDGTQLAFEAGYPEHVDVINIDGSGRRTVTTGGQPAWSPDGRELAVVRPVQGLCEPWNYMTRIFAVTLDGRTERMITPLGSSTWCDPEDSEPDWQPRCTQYGHGGRDHLRGMPSDDVICALAGRDSVRAEAGDDVVIGGSGNDVIEGGPGKDRLFGAAGDDIIRARDGEPDIVNGGPGRDRAQIDARLDRVSSVEELLP